MTDPQVTVELGSGVIPLGIIILIAIIYVIYKTIKTKKVEPTIQPIPVEQPVSAQQPTVDRGEFSAAIAAALAVYLGPNIEGIRIHSITPRA